MDYIQINSIEDIDTSRISITQINQRYLDRNGNRYATRYNPKTRSIEMVRLVASREEAVKVKNEILRNRNKDFRNTLSESSIFSSQQMIPDRVPIKGNQQPLNPFDQSFLSQDSMFATSEDNFSVDHPSDHLTGDLASSPITNDIYQKTLPKADHDPYIDDDFSFFASAAKVNKAPQAESIREEKKQTPDESSFYEVPFMEKLLAELQRNKDRSWAIMNNIRKSRFFEGQERESDLLGNLMRQIDIECWQKGDAGVNYYKELVNFPRPVNYYTPRLSSERKDKVEAIESDETKMEMIRRWEIQDAFMDIFKSYERVAENILKLFADTPDESLRSISAQSQQLFRDARTGTTVVIDESKRLQEEILAWKNRFA